ncbi:acyltransferase [Sphingobacterium phlebotomi]|uniref:Acyltransferase n=1 Tax=Sphingobacterium phlebotomi TaxID=2605433 RepID=A0A5D4H8G3_9SPHI|nr:acyltransferase [Sphingobacterium phlebotomi]TYR36844.1 acyltransferase [Sphingobacterium phlebotomi]
MRLKNIIIFPLKYIHPVLWAKLLGVKVGKDCKFYKVSFSTEPYLITIGDNVAITEGVRIFTHGGSRIARKKHPKFDVFGKVKIGDGVYIGANSIILPGVVIGDGVLIAAGSVVVNSIPENCVVGGNPARYLCDVDEYIRRNEKYDLGTKGLSFKQKKLILLSTDNSKLITKTYLDINRL